MLSRTEIERLAAAAHALRPDWAIPSLCTWLMTDHAGKAYRDVAVALAWVATDTATHTPKRMNELGPWWTAARVASSDATDTLSARCQQIGHGSYLADNCGACRADRIGADGPSDPPTSPIDPDVAARGAAAVRAALRSAS